MAAKAAEAVGKKMFAEDEKTKDVLLGLGEDTLPMKQAAHTRAVRVAAVERAKLQIRKPFLRMLGVPNEYFKEEFWKELAEKTADIPDENFISPAPHVAVPALQGLNYTFEEPDLKSMYLSLLAAASDDRRADQAHPAFADFIRQLAPDEAKALNVILGADQLIPLARLVDKPVDRIGSPANSFNILMPYLINLRQSDGVFVEEPRMPMWIDNWVRLGLVEAIYDEFVAGENSYDWVKERPEFIRLEAENRISVIDFTKGLVRPTSLGKQFFAVVR